MKIAVDGMGGDKAPKVVVEGAVEAVKESDVEIVLVGDKGILKKELSEAKVSSSRISICHAREVIGMHEPPAASVRRKRDSSISVAVNLAKQGEVDAVVTAGNTGAAICATTLSLRLLPGVERPGIAVSIPTLTGVSLLIDVGANIDAKPTHLLQYAIMGDVYFRHIVGKKEPTIALLNIGEEESKGTEFVKETHRLLNQAHLRFIGNVEGDDLFTGKSDVIVCDGFVGNVALKVSESLAGALSELLKRELTKSMITKLGALLSRPAFRALKKEIDYAEYGGAPLFGIDGICIISHGGSSPKAIKNAIRIAGEFVNHKINQHIIEAIKRKCLTA